MAEAGQIPESFKVFHQCLVIQSLMRLGLTLESGSPRKDASEFSLRYLVNAMWNTFLEVILLALVLRIPLVSYVHHLLPVDCDSMVTENLSPRFNPAQRASKPSTPSHRI